jgi:phosphoglycerate dehydrogenase-like enzyme
MSSGRDRLPIRANLGRFAPFMIDGLREALPDERFVAFPEEGAGEPAEIVVTLLVQPHGIERALTPEVRWVHVLGAGVDGFPLEQAGDRVVTCSRGASSGAIAEFTLAAMLAFEKRLPETWITSPPERWNVADLGGLAGRTLGLVGIGAIGSEVARRALAFDMRVVAVRCRSAAPPVEGVELLDGLHDVLGCADHVVVAAPATPETHHLLDAAAFGVMKRGVHLVNVARGSLVDQQALLDALDRGIVARASLDVVDPEPLPEGHWLYSHPAVRLSPHVSWSSPGTGGRTIELFLENLRRWRAGEDLAGVVDVGAGY